MENGMWNCKERRKATWLKNLRARIQDAVDNKRADSTELENAGLLKDDIDIELALRRATSRGQVKIIEFILGPVEIKNRRHYRTDNPMRNVIHTEMFETTFRRFNVIDGGAFDVAHLCHFLISYIIGNSDSTSVKRFTGKGNVVDRSFDPAAHIRSFGPELTRILMRLLEDSTLPDFAAFDTRYSKMLVIYRSNCQLRRREKEIVRLLGGCNCDKGVKKFMHSSRRFNGYMDRWESNTKNYQNLRKSQLSELRDFLATRGSSSCLKGAIHQVILSYISPMLRHVDENTQMLAEDSIGADMVSLLISHGCQVNDEDGSGISPLQLAVSYINYDVVKVLLEFGADVKNITFEGGMLERKFRRNLSVVKNLLDIVEALGEYGFVMNGFHHYRVVRFLVEPDLVYLDVNDMPIDSFIYHTDEKMSMYYNHIVDMTSSECHSNVDENFSPIKEYLKIKKLLRIVEKNNWYLDTKRRQLLQRCLSLLINCPNVLLNLPQDDDNDNNNTEIGLEEMRMSDGTKYSDFVRYNHKRTAELFRACDWREMREFFEESKRFQHEQQLSIRLLKARIYRSSIKDYLRIIVADRFWCNNSSMRYMVEAVPEIRDKIEENLSERNFINDMYKSILPDVIPNPELEVYELPQVFIEDRLALRCNQLYEDDTVYAYRWYKTFIKKNLI